tara:strand:+ start:12469 stop:12951 length:483 start_codon:yes stop_codon:yes gene_type:complete
MITSFSQMDKSSRIWIYQSNRKFIDSEVKEIEGLLTDFLKSWTAHGSKLQTAYLLKYNRFIIIALNESNVAATGCSIDSCVHFIQELESKYEVNLLDKMNISFKQGQYVSYKPIDDFKKLVKNKSVSIKTLVFNNLVVDISDFEKNWEVPAQRSWHARFF